MPNLQAISTSFEAQEYIQRFYREKLITDFVPGRIVAYLLQSLADLREQVSTDDNLRHYKRDITGTLNSVIRRTPYNFSSFAPSFFFSIKFDFLMESYSKTDYFIVHALIRLLDCFFSLPEGTTTYSYIKSCKNYGQFLSYVSSFHQHPQADPLTPERSQQGTSDDPLAEGERPDFLADILAKGSKGTSYAERVAELDARKRAFVSQQAGQFLDILRVEIKRKYGEKTTIEEKRDLVEWLNQEVIRMGMAFKNPKVGKKSMLIVDKGKNPLEGRFQFRTEIDDSGTGKTETLSTSKLSVLLENLLLIDPQVAFEINDGSLTL